MTVNPIVDSSFFFFFLDKINLGNSLAVQWLGLFILTAGGPGLILVREVIFSKQHGVAKKLKKKNKHKINLVALVMEIRILTHFQ